MILRVEVELIIIMVDFNQDMRVKNIEEWREELIMREVLMGGVGAFNAQNTYVGIKTNRFHYVYSQCESNESWILIAWRRY